MKNKKYPAAFSRTTGDQVKSKIMSPEYVQLTLDVYMSPRQYAELLEKYFEKSFTITIEGEE